MLLLVNFNNTSSTEIFVLFATAETQRFRKKTNLFITTTMVTIAI